MQIVFVHGFGLGPTIWDDILTQISVPFKVLSLPGYDGNDSFDSIDQYSLWLSTQLFEDCLLVAHSMAGYIAIDMVKKYTSKVIGLCLFHSHVYTDSSDKISARLKSKDFIKKNGAIKYLQSFHSGLFYKANEQQLLRLSRLEIPDQTLISNLKAMIDREDHQNTLANSTIPIMFIIGFHDKLLTMNLWLEQTILTPIADVVILKNSAHMGMMEQPIEVANALLSFMKRLN